MKIIFPEREEIERVTRESLRRNFHLYDEEHAVHLLKRENIVWIGYRGKSNKNSRTKSDLQKQSDSIL